MKSWLFLLGAGLIILSACSAQYQSKNYDDVYYSGKNKPDNDHSFVVKPTKVEPTQFTQAEQPAQQEITSPATSATPTPDSSTVTKDGNSYITNNFYGDDYYDYAYSARLRRFHDNCYYNGYYSDYYTNSYWYDYDPWNWGLSIYMGYNWWYPSIYSSWRWPYYSWGFGYSGWWDPYYYPGYGYYGYGYNLGYYNGFYDGYWLGSWDGPGHYYYNSYDDNTHYYGRRHSVGSSGSVASNHRNTTFAERYESRIADELNGGSGNLRSGTRNIGSSSLSGRNNNDEALQVRNSSRNTPVNSTETQRPVRYTYQGTRNQNTSQPSGTLRNQGNIQPYNSPVYSKPRSGNEYTAPKYRNSTSGNENNTGKPNSGNQYSAPNRQVNSNPSTNYNNSRTTQPSNQTPRTNNNPERTYQNRSNPGRSTYATPSRSNENSAPARNYNYSSPSNSGNSYTPSRNNSSYSAPSRSSESSSPSRSSGSSNSGSSGSGSGRRR